MFSSPTDQETRCSAERSGHGCSCCSKHEVDAACGTGHHRRIFNSCSICAMRHMADTWSSKNTGRRVTHAPLPAPMWNPKPLGRPCAAGRTEVSGTSLVAPMCANKSCGNALPLFYERHGRQCFRWAACCASCTSGARVCVSRHLAVSGHSRAVILSRAKWVGSPLAAISPNIVRRPYPFWRKYSEEESTEDR